MTSKTARNHKETGKSIEVECSAMKAKMNDASVNLGGSVKEKFGEKVRNTIKVQT